MPKIVPKIKRIETPISVVHQSNEAPIVESTCSSNSKKYCCTTRSGTATRTTMFTFICNGSNDNADTSPTTCSCSWTYTTAHFFACSPLRLRRHALHNNTFSRYCCFMMIKSSFCQMISV
eukprot:GHVR01030103.1.p1 GENE.GHVR01030103.1~~GHVR01030103.1.p1  ORF type:complete len:120 (-),score=2.15 GHVR01030103.1:89-448(-)